MVSDNKLFENNKKQISWLKENKIKNILIRSFKVLKNLTIYFHYFIEFSTEAESDRYL